jgi:hypothetical protein
MAAYHKPPKSELHPNLTVSLIIIPYSHIKLGICSTVGALPQKGRGNK